MTDDKDLADLCRSFSHCGRTEGSAWYDHSNLGSNLRMTEFQAAVLLAQLARLEEHVARRQRNAALLDEAMADIPAIHQLAPAPRMTRRSYHMYIFRVNQTELGISRGAFIERSKPRVCRHRKDGTDRSIAMAFSPTPIWDRGMVSGPPWPAREQITGAFPVQCANRFATTPFGFRTACCSPTNHKSSFWPRQFAR